MHNKLQPEDLQEKIRVAYENNLIECGRLPPEPEPLNTCTAP